jgi:hypothetical protein
MTSPTRVFKIPVVNGPNRLRGKQEGAMYDGDQAVSDIYALIDLEAKENGVTTKGAIMLLLSELPEDKRSRWLATITASNPLLSTKVSSEIAFRFAGRQTSLSSWTDSARGHAG